MQGWKPCSTFAYLHREKHLVKLGNDIFLMNLLYTVFYNFLRKKHRLQYFYVHACATICNMQKGEKMVQFKTCEYTNTYSEIEGFQESRTLSYSVADMPDGVHIVVRQESGAGVQSEACSCHSATFEYVVSFVKYLHENGVGLSSWYDLLDDLNIQYTVA